MEDYDVDNLSYEVLLTKIRGELKFYELVRKKDVVKKLAEKLEKMGVVKEMICARIIEDLRGYGISERMIYKTLDVEQKRQYNKSAQSAEVDVNKVTVEISTSGTEGAAKKEDESIYDVLRAAKREPTIQTADDLDDAVNKFREEVVHNVPAAIDKTRILELEREKDDLKKELVNLTNAFAGVKQEIPEEWKNPAVIRLEARVAELELEKEEAEHTTKELSEALKQQGIFKTAKDLPTPDSATTATPKGELTMDLNRFVAAMIAMRNNNAKLVYITVDKEGLVSAIEADYQRARRLKVGVIT